MGFLKHADKDRVGFPFLAMQAYGKDDFVGWRKLKRVFIDGLQTGGRLCFQLRRWERVTQLKPLLFLGSAGIVGFWGAYESFQSGFGSVIKPALPDASEDCMFVHALMRRCFRRWQSWLDIIPSVVTHSFFSLSFKADSDLDIVKAISLSLSLVTQRETYY